MFPKKTYRIENTRDHKRLKAVYLVKYHFANAVEGSEPFVSNIKDLSAGGLKFWSKFYIPQDTLITLSFWIPPLDRTIHGLARVIRVKNGPKEEFYYIAAQFIEIPAQDQIAIREFIEDLAKNPESRPFIEDAFVVHRQLSLK